MAIRYVEGEEELADMERRKRVAGAALKSTGAKRVFAPSVAEELQARPKEASVARSEAAGKARFDRKTYQRAYMRIYLPKWRARRKAT